MLWNSKKIVVYEINEEKNFARLAGWLTQVKNICDYALIVGPLALSLKSKTF